MMFLEVLTDGVSQTAVLHGAAERFHILTLTTMGPILIEASSFGISRLEFVDLKECRIKEVACSDALSNLVSAVVRAINEPGVKVSLPLVIKGTPFQRSVWRHLQTISVGTTRTYAEIACALGAPRSYRAVANACAANTIAILIPCHRAIRSDGSYGGYRWGERRKGEILFRERASCA